MKKLFDIIIQIFFLVMFTVLFLGLVISISKLSKNANIQGLIIGFGVVFYIAIVGRIYMALND